MSVTLQGVGVAYQRVGFVRNTRRLGGDSINDRLTVGGPPLELFLCSSRRAPKKVHYHEDREEQQDWDDVVVQERDSPREELLQWNQRKRVTHGVSGVTKFGGLDQPAQRIKHTDGHGGNRRYGGGCAR
ncbi:MAG: hypothetical protein ACYDA3_13480 [Gaiellaceae bacterium]